MHERENQAVRNWTNTRFLKRGQCELCGLKSEGKSLDWHHLKYCVPHERADIVEVCRACHKAFHGKDSVRMRRKHEKVSKYVLALRVLLSKKGNSVSKVTQKRLGMPYFPRIGAAKPFRQLFSEKEAEK